MPSKKPKKLEHLIERIKSCIALGAYRDTFHAALRKNERNITFPEIIPVLAAGRQEKSKGQFDEAFKAWNYAPRAQTVDGLDLRIIVSFDDERDLLTIPPFILSEGIKI